MLKAISLSSSEARLRNRKAKIETTAERIATMTGTVRPAHENHQPFSALEMPVIGVSTSGDLVAAFQFDLRADGGKVGI